MPEDHDDHDDLRRLSVTVRRTLSADEQDVFAVLSDPKTYAYWVVGAVWVGNEDPEWPTPGTHFEHRVGTRVPLLQIRDKTTVDELEAPRRLRLTARWRPGGVAKVEMRLDQEAPGRTVVAMEEWPQKGPMLWMWPLVRHGVRIRNTISLGRLQELAEHRARTASAGSA